MTKEIKTVAVIGGGLMGCGIAQVFAAKETLSVNLYDSYCSKESLLDRVAGNLRTLENKGVIGKEETLAILDRIHPTSSLEEAVKTADFVIECIPEDLTLKQDLFRDIEAFCSEDTIFATNTSVMSITEISAKTIHKQRVVGTHFWNPPYLIPLVEVVKAEETSEEVMDLTMAFLKDVGKHPIRVNKDVPGFVANRLQHALWREAISIVEHGIADAKTVDEAVKMSFGLRLPVLGPIENADMVGTDLTFSIHDYILKHLENSPEASPLLKGLKEEGKLGFKSGEGFQKWDDASISASRAQLTDHLIKVIYGK